MENLDAEFIDVIDLVDFTFSLSFIEKWSHKYGRRLARLFQIKIMKSLESRKVLKLSMLYKFLVTDSGFSPDVVKAFLLDVDYEIYSPIISGSLEAV
tara:strand:+ start:1584 stop:1874 length:291 start_codon:yes stop_codon:yes gene_type:complete